MSLIPLGAFLQAAAAPLVRNVLASLGIGIISYAAVTTLLGLLLVQARGYWNGMPDMVLALLGLAGLGDSAGILIGALMFRAGLNTLSRYGKLP
jgi:hypothetical protein